MTMEVLQNKRQIAGARKRMEEREISFLESRFGLLLKRLGLAGGVAVGDYIKSWDVLRTLEFLETHLDKTAPIADIGCFASEVLLSLHQLGFSQLTGIDLNDKLKEMPLSDQIKYEVSDFKHTRFADAAFTAITSISVIEHGFEADALFKEMSRLLCPGGYFIASFDYWPQKIDTSKTKFFGMDWMIFSKDDLTKTLGVAAQYGLQPIGSMEYAAGDAVIHCAGKHYTFGLMILQKLR